MASVSSFPDTMWENINTETFLRLYCQEDYNNVIEDKQKEDSLPTAENWQEKAAEIHQNMANELGDRLFDSIPVKDKTYFLRKLGFALYGLPEKYIDLDDIGYSEDKLKIIKAVAEKIVELQGNQRDLIICHTMFVIYFIEGQPLIPVPVFRVPKPGCKVNENCPMMFVDNEQRKYDNWQCFLKENNLPKCWISYPVDGIYQTLEDGSVMIESCKSPACGIIRETLDVLDTTSTLATVGTTVAVLASLVVPIAAPFMIATGVVSGTAGVYSTGRSIAGLVDRGTHGQSVAPTDPAARGHWISTASSVLSVASLGAVKAVSSAAHTGQVASKAALIATDCLQVSSANIKHKRTCAVSTRQTVPHDDKTTQTPYKSEMEMFHGTKCGQEVAHGELENGCELERISEVHSFEPQYFIQYLILFIAKEKYHIK